MLSAIIVGAGSSRRVGFDKLTAPVAGRTVIGHTIAAFQNCASVAEIVVVTRADRVHDFDLLLGGRFSKLRRIIAGGVHRQDSVREGLKAIAAGTAFVAVHDAARPLVRPELIEEVLAVAQTHGAAAAAAAVTDTLKCATDDYFVAGSVDRRALFAMQTPQIFAHELLVRAYEKVFAEQRQITDEVSAVELLGAPVRIVPNAKPNLKVTFASDLRLVETLLATR